MKPFYPTIGADGGASEFENKDMNFSDMKYLYEVLEPKYRQTVQVIKPCLPLISLGFCFILTTC